jgi:uroporphyrinogen III methyltransferase/synthase
MYSSTVRAVQPRHAGVAPTIVACSTLTQRGWRCRQADGMTRTGKEIPSMTAMVYLVGAGPGDPKLLSLRGAELLQLADVVFFDYLVNPVITALADGDAELICLGRHGHGRIWSQDEINEAMVRAARSGKVVVRLKGGDPSVFGRLFAETDYLATHKIAFEVVPGITAASAASAYAGVLLTSRQCASAVALVTGHELQDKDEGRLDFWALARFPGTLVIYMGVTTAERWVGRLIECGKSKDTPVALIQRCSFSNQQTQRCRLEEVPDRLTPYSKFAPPVLAIVGDIVDQATNIDWFARRPLLANTVLVTRPRHQQSAMTSALTSLGAHVLHQPAIQIGCARDQTALDDAVGSANQYDWIVFSSANGVRYFLDQLLASGRDVRHLGNCRLAAIGPATAAALGQYGLRADLIPSSFRAEPLAGVLRGQVAGRSVLLVRAGRGREVLAKTLQPLAKRLRQVVAYESTDIETGDEQVLAALDAGQVHWTTVTSSAIARSLVRMLGHRLKHTKLVSISPLTTQTLTELGFTPAVEATEYTTQGIVDAIVKAQIETQSSSLEI